MEEGEGLLEPAVSSARRRFTKRGGCCYWVAPSIVACLVAYGLVVSIVGCVLHRWSGMWAVQVALCVAFTFSAAMSGWSFWAIVFTEPGFNESDDFCSLPQYRSRPRVDPQRKEETYELNAVRWCRKCELYKPDRAHHCSQAGRCVLRMDHFCPWVNQTVGLRNHKHFFLFLLWTSILCLFACTVLILTLVLREPGMDLIQWTAWDWQMGWVAFYTLLFALTLTIFGFQHLVLILTNATTLESLKSDSRWHRGSKRLNWEEVMGTKYQLLPTPTIGGGDGFTFRER